MTQGSKTEGMNGSSPDAEAPAEAKEHAESRMRELYEQMLAIRAEMNALVREMAGEDVADYTLRRTDGAQITLDELFGDHDDLIVVHNMGQSCRYCTLWADGFNGVVDHLTSRTAFVVASPDAPDTQRSFAESRGWQFPMVSTAGSSFTEDMGYAADGGYLPGFSTFRRQDDGSIRRIARGYFGPGDDFCSVWHLFDQLHDGVDDWEPQFRYDD